MRPVTQELEEEEEEVEVEEATNNKKEEEGVREISPSPQSD